MVSNTGRLNAWLGLAWLLLCLPALADGASLEARVDRDTLYENETLKLTLTGTMPFSMDISQLLNLSDMDLPEPDITALQDNFEIMDRHQKYSLRTVNGESEATIAWTYQLAPKRTGTLSIPALPFKDAQSDPLSITVQSGNAPPQQGEAPSAILEVTTDKDAVYVQEQLVVTIRLYYRGNLIRGELSEPELANVLMEKMGKQREYERVRHGERYRVVERRYVIYPQTTDAITLSDIRFRGRVRNADQGLQFLRERADKVTVPVSGKPDGFSGRVWLPATSLEISQQWDNARQTVQVGDNIERTVTIDALGLLGSALPPIEPSYPEALRSYPEQPDTTADVNDRTVTSSRTEKTTLVAVEPGTVRIPEIRIPWWDTVNDRQREAVIPARTITIKAADDQAAATAPTRGDSGGDPAPSTEQPSSEPPASEPGNRESGSVWFWIALVLGALWCMTLALWWWRNRDHTGPEARPARPDDERALFRELLAHARRGDGNTLQLLPAWACVRFGRDDLHSVSDLLAVHDDPSLEHAIRQLQEHLYSERVDAGWSPEPLVDALRRLRETAPSQEDSDDSLPPLYPQRLGKL
ncbi:hypothetical protein CF392_05800 [Tamilnaduibacter salinus]|uniref:DUF7939 domain-containing protein n=1 Tax=Tamilnaduibacter salinus TaxID=1484056 RepID=A0A2A2I458_9GAMM|nr:BatD family protein [Tamilnaduibacter salinus]PAV26447.1 hypothetical protein CF392_05800 [Tamilnaduibacter salinus]